MANVAIALILKTMGNTAKISDHIKSEVYRLSAHSNPIPVIAERVKLAQSTVRRLLDTWDNQKQVAKRELAEHEHPLAFQREPTSNFILMASSDPEKNFAVINAYQKMINP